IRFPYGPAELFFQPSEREPRVGATFRLFVDNNGMDVARAEYLHYTGQPIPAGSIGTGRKWIVEDADPISCIQYYRDGVLTLSDWLKSYSGIQECAWFAADDVTPFLRMCSLFSLRPFRKILRMGRGLFKPPAGNVVDHSHAMHRRTAKGEREL